jgi:hypothetical protein
VTHIHKGINPSSAHDIYWTGDLVLKGFKIGVVAGLVALTVSKYFSFLFIFLFLSLYRFDPIQMSTYTGFTIS